MRDASNTVTIDKEVEGHWRVTLDHPPVNTLDDLMYDELFDLVEAMREEPLLKVVTFESANPEFFLAHYGIGESSSRFGTPRWIETAVALADSSVLSIAVVRGRARGGGCEFVQACDLRFASRESAIFGQPEVGFGLIPGGGALERLPLLTGRARALEMVLGADDYDADTAERYGLINRAIPDAELDGFVAEFVRRILSFDRQALATSKAILNRAGVPERGLLEETQTTFSATLRWPNAVARNAKARELGLGAAGDYELNLGRHAAEF